MSHCHNVNRIIPSFAKKRETLGCWMAGGALFIISGLFSRHLEYVALGSLFFFFPILGWAKSRLGKWLWSRRAVTSNVVIVERKHIEADDMAAYFIAPRYAVTHDEEWILELGATPAQLAIDPYVTRVQVKVNESQYDSCTRKTSVAIFYREPKPFVFLLRDEI